MPTNNQNGYDQVEVKLTGIPIKSNKSQAFQREITIISASTDKQNSNRNTKRKSVETYNFHQDKQSSGVVDSLDV